MTPPNLESWSRWDFSELNDFNFKVDHNCSIPKYKQESDYPNIQHRHNSCKIGCGE